MAKVFSVVDFKAGLDVRKTALTAPGGTLRILENAVLNQGGEIMKRFAFVPMTTVAAAPPLAMAGQGDALHFFGFGAGSVPAGSLPAPAFYHQLASPPEGMTEILDVEAFDDKFYVCARGASGQTYCWYNDAPVVQDGSQAHGSYARTWKSKMYRIDGKYLRFSAVGNPAQNNPSAPNEPGAGFINLSIHDPDGEQLQAMEVYYDQMAIMARLQTQMWQLDPDPTKDNLKQLLRIGTTSPRSMMQFGTGDILFLSDSGVRSLKAMSFTTSAASVSDVGSAIDLLLIPVMRADLEGTRKAEAIVQPIQGRYWLALGDTIYVLSYFPAGQITAWSTFKPGFNVQNFGLVNNYVFCMTPAGAVYLYGGVARNEYDSSKITIRTPHMSADNPTQNKRIQSVDIMCQGQWTLDVGMLPNNVNAFERVATVQDNTFGLMSIPFAGYGTHFGAHLEHAAPGPAVLAALHFNLQEGTVK